jgi:hypothetical protein
MGATCDRTYRGHLLRKNSWLQLQESLLNVRYALMATKVRSAAKLRDGPNPEVHAGSRCFPVAREVDIPRAARDVSRNRGLLKRPY